jgi:DNA-directed RNA polymerase specialized sigma24 family protein
MRAPGRSGLAARFIGTGREQPEPDRGEPGKPEPGDPTARISALLWSSPPPSRTIAAMRLSAADLAAAYAELRVVAHRMASAAPATLAGTAGVHEVIADVLADESERTWADRAHFVRHCILRLRGLWLNHRRKGRRQLNALVAQGFLVPGDDPGEPAAPDPATTLALLGVLEDAAEQGILEDPSRAITGFLAKFVLGMTDPEAAAAAGTSVGTLKRDVAAILSWARGTLEAERADLRRRAEAIRGDARVRRGEEIAAVAARVLLGRERLAEVAASLGTTRKRALADLEFFLTWRPAAAVAEAACR